MESQVFQKIFEPRLAIATWAVSNNPAWGRVVELKPLGFLAQPQRPVESRGLNPTSQHLEFCSSAASGSRSSVVIVIIVVRITNSSDLNWSHVWLDWNWSHVWLDWNWSHVDQNRNLSDVGLSDVSHCRKLPKQLRRSRSLKRKRKRWNRSQMRRNRSRKWKRLSRSQKRKQLRRCRKCESLTRRNLNRSVAKVVGPQNASVETDRWYEESDDEIEAEFYQDQDLEKINNFSSMYNILINLSSSVRRTKLFYSFGQTNRVRL